MISDDLQDQAAIYVLGALDRAETAAFEENQGNVPHAKQLYQELVNLYPSTKVAEIARARLTDLESRK